MQLSTQIKQITKLMQDDKSLSKLLKELETASNNYDAPKSNPLAQVVVDVNRQLNRQGIFPLKFNASYFSQNRDYRKRHLELSWQRNDLVSHNGLRPLKVTKSHGSGFRLQIYGDGEIMLGLSNRYAEAGVAGVENFSKNIINDDGYLDFWFEKLIKKYSFDLNWIDDDFYAEDFGELSDYVKLNHKKAVNTFIWIWIRKPVPASSKRSVNLFTKNIVKSFIELAPFFYSMLFNLQPKKSKTHSSTKGQLTREKLRNILLESEDRCQNEDCPVKLKHQTLQVAHLVPGIHHLSNVVALCSTCHDKQRPRDSDIKLNMKSSPRSGGKRIYTATVQTPNGAEKWKLKSGHELKRFRK